ncbi:MAG: DGQHR domain-containing protein [Brevundimonas sp.]|jgi:DGQHR domain-containing protein
MAREPIAGLANREDPRAITFYALRIKQPVGDFYCAVIPSDKLIEITYFDIRGLTQKDDFTDFMGIQRELDPGRVADIKRYVNTLDASFPTAIVLAVDERCAEFEDVAGAVEADGTARLVRLTLKNHLSPEEGLDPILYRDIARIIDGQHRIAGLIGYEGPTFEMNVSIFVGADMPTQASIFSTVNQAQTKVNRSLVYDLYAYQKTRSPEKTCHEIAVLLDREKDSPLYKMIKRLGVATQGRFGETLSQASFVKGLIQYISRDVLSDREAAKRGKPFPSPAARYEDTLILRPFFVSGEDEIIADLIWDYFAAVQEKWPQAWGQTGRGWVLNKTAGYAGLMRFLLPCYKSLIGQSNRVPTKGDFDRVFGSIQLSDDAFRSEHIRPGTSGEKYVFDMLLEKAEL